MVRKNYIHVLLGQESSVKLLSYRGATKIAYYGKRKIIFRLQSVCILTVTRYTMWELIVEKLYKDCFFYRGPWLNW